MSTPALAFLFSIVGAMVIPLFPVEGCSLEINFYLVPQRLPKTFERDFHSLGTESKRWVSCPSFSANFCSQAPKNFLSPCLSVKPLKKTELCTINTEKAKPQGGNVGSQMSLTVALSGFTLGPVPEVHLSFIPGSGDRHDPRPQVWGCCSSRGRS